MSSTITIYRGNSLGPANIVGIPDGARLLFTVKRKTDRRNDDAEAVIKKDITNSFFLSAEETDIQPGEYKYDMKLIAEAYELNSLPGTFQILNRVGVRDE